MTLILASGSPRRRDILSDAGYDFTVMPPDIEENAPISLGVAEMCEENARMKADEIFQKHSDAVVVGSDTLVFLDGVPMGKPHTEERAREMLRKLSGRVNTVCTGVAVIGPQGTRTFSEMVEVEFLPFDEEVISLYMSRVDVLDKAGAFAAQQEAELIIREIRGDIATVMGLPIAQLKDCLAEFGLQRSM